MDLRRHARTIAAISVAMLVLPLPAVAVTWGPERTITDEAHEIGPNALAESSAAITIGFRTEAGIFVRRSTDGGTSWLDAVELSTSAESVPALAASGATVDAVWVQLGGDGRYRLMHRRSTNDGATWSPAVSLVRSGNPLGVPSVGREADRVAVAWSNLGTGRISVIVSLDGGLAWEAQDIIGVTSMRPLPDGPFVEALPDVAIATERRPGDDIHRIFVSFNEHPTTFHVARSTDDGVSWTRKGVGVQVAPGTSIAAKGSVVLVGYTFRANFPSTWVEVARSSNGGHSWLQDEIRLSEPPKPWSDSLIVSVRGNAFRAAFSRCVYGGCTGGMKQVLYTESVNGGRTWAPTVRVFRATSAQGTPVGVDIAGGSVIVAYRACFDAGAGEAACEVRVRQGT